MTQHAVSDHISILSLESVETETPKDELDDVNDDEKKEDFFCLHVFVAGILAILDISCYCYDFIDQHQNHSYSPAKGYCFFYAAGNSCDCCY